MRKFLFLGTIALVALTMLTAASPGSVAASGPTYYVVRYGDTLDAIAWRYGTTTWALAHANGIGNPNLIYMGQLLVIPVKGYPYAPIPYHQPVVYHPRPTFGCYYYVRYGDTMLSIARRFGGDAWTIARANSIYNLNWIYAGQRLFIPGCN